MSPVRSGTDPAFDSTFTDAYSSGYDTLDATDAGSYYQVTSGTVQFTPTGPLTAQTETLVTNPTPGNYSTTPDNGGYIIEYDDEISPGSTPSLDLYGLLFTDNNANPSVNAYDYLNLYPDTSNNGAFAEAISTASGITGQDGETFALSPAPELSQFGMLALMSLGLDGLIVRARRKNDLA